MTGYSSEENVNNIEVPHLHFGMQLIFDESQKEGTNQIWIDVYNIIEFLKRNRAEVYREQEGEIKDYKRKYEFMEQSIHD
jgi:predicted ATPase